MIADFADSSWNSQIVLKEVENPSAYGIAQLRLDGGIEKLIEKPENPPSSLALVGIYMFDYHIFEAVDSIQPSARGEYEITDAIQWLIDHGYTVYPHIHKGWWIDTGKPTDMLEANSYVLEEIRPMIAESARIDERSSVDPRVTVQPGAQILNSIIRGPTVIGKNTTIENSYIGPFTSIYHHCEIRNCEIERSIILENSRIIDIDQTLRDSLIGRSASVKRSSGKPSGIKMNLGDYGTVWV